MRGRRRPGVCGCGGIDMGDSAGPVVCRAYKIHFRKYRHAVDRRKILRSKLSAATGRWSVHVDNRIGSVDCDTRDCGRYRRLSGGKRGLQPGDRGWRTVRLVPGGRVRHGQRAYVQRILRGCILQNAKVGDVFTIDSEFVVLVAKNGNQWTLQRGYGLSAPAATQFHDVDGTLHGAGLLPWRLELVVDVGYGEGSARDQ